MERKSFFSAHDGVGVAVVLSHMGCVSVRAGKITLRSPLTSGSKPVQPLDPETQHLQCSVFAGSSLAAGLGQFVTCLEDEWSYP